MNKLITAIALCLGLVAASGVQASLMVADDGQTVYDTDKNIYWVANANLAATKMCL